jgi:hypothetical protein
MSPCPRRTVSGPLLAGNFQATFGFASDEIRGLFLAVDADLAVSAVPGLSSRYAGDRR